MSIKLKTPEDIEYLAQGGKILAGVLDTLEEAVTVGTIPRDLDKMAREMIRLHDCKPAFLNYAPAGSPPYPAALCFSRNSGVVHGLPGDEPINDRDIIGLDCGLIYRDKYFLDSARTVVVGDSKEDEKMASVAEEALRRGIEQAQVGNRIGDISHAIQTYAEAQGYSIITSLVGHGVGFAVHEDPQVPNFGKAGKGPVIEEGLVIAIEPMITTRDPHVVTGEDGWVVEVASGAHAAHAEHTVAVTKDGPRILTR